MFRRSVSLFRFPSSTVSSHRSRHNNYYRRCVINKSKRFVADQHHHEASLSSSFSTFIDQEIAQRQATNDDDMCFCNICLKDVSDVVTFNDSNNNKDHNRDFFSVLEHHSYSHYIDAEAIDFLHRGRGGGEETISSSSSDVA